MVAIGLALYSCTKCGPIWDDWLQSPKSCRSGTRGCAWRRGRRGGMLTGKSREPSMKVFRIAAVMTLLTAPAYAQMQTPNINLIPELQSKSPEEKEQEAQQQKA